MRQRTTFRQGAYTAQRQRRHRAARVYRWPLHPNEEAQHYILPRMIGGAVSDPSKGMAALSRVGVSFRLTWWQRILLRIPYKRTLRMQRMILKNLSS
jgi:hypothetical protein